MKTLNNLALILALGAAPALAGGAVVNDYPTVARADYVFACMASNGQSSVMLERCSCSIDTIAAILPYDAYVNAETVLRTLQLTGDRTGALRASERHKAMVADLRRAQAEADIVCF
ncbi:MAG: hypothetical protein CVT86_03140 [Alphaproteobacteria bacterium HGW-Alphaproteobacteria-8]|nr:MAG: hypothetical protein CVT86_03140 [Alphaproteobacteria bacterium HGW-Alphaproteobacteria-8]